MSDGLTDARKNISSEQEMERLIKLLNYHQTQLEEITEDMKKMVEKNKKTDGTI